jgi:phosphoenolpyruvate synthase/pyruvate phosphate dikinase
MEQGIDSLSLNPDTVVATWRALAAPASAPQSSAAA